MRFSLIDFHNIINSFVLIDMKKIVAILAFLPTISLYAQQATNTNTKIDSTQPKANHISFATVSLGFIDYYRNYYDLPKGFEKNNTSGFAPVYAKLEYVIHKNVSLAATANYDNFQYNYYQIYNGNGDIYKRYKVNYFTLVGIGLSCYYSLNNYIHIKKVSTFVGLGFSLNHINYSGFPSGDSTITNRTDHTLTPYLKVGARYAINKISYLFADLGYDKQSILSLGFSCNLEK